MTSEIPILPMRRFKLLLAYLLAMISGLVIPLSSFLIGSILNSFPDIVSNPAKIINRSTFVIYVGIGAMLVSAAASCIVTRTNSSLTRDRRARYIVNILDKDLTWFGRHETLMPFAMQIESELQAMKQWYEIHLPRVLYAVSSLLGSIIVSIYTDWRTTLLLLSSLPVLVCVTWLANLVWHRLSTEAECSKLVEKLQYQLSRVSEIALFESGCYELDSYSKTDREFDRGQTWSYCLYSALISASLAANGVLYWISFSADSGLSVGSVLTIFFSIAISISRILPGISSLSKYGRYKELARQTAEMLQDHSSSPSPVAFEKLDDNPPSISLHGLRFGYHGHELFRGLDLKIEAGSWNLITGESGCGKSTLLKLMLGLLDCENEQMVRWNDTPLKHYEQKKLFQKVAYLSQGVNWVTETDVESNLSLQDSNFPPEKTLQLISELYLPEEEVTLQTTVSSLSLDQLQRLSLARAILGGKCQVLLMDEPTSFCSTEDSVRLFAILKKWVGSKTLVVIAHGLDAALHPYFSTKLQLSRQGTLRELDSVDSSPVVVRSRTSHFSSRPVLHAPQEKWSYFPLLLLRISKHFKLLLIYLLYLLSNALSSLIFFLQTFILTEVVVDLLLLTESSTETNQFLFSAAVDWANFTLQVFLRDYLTIQLGVVQRRQLLESIFGKAEAVADLLSETPSVGLAVVTDIEYLTNVLIEQVPNRVKILTNVISTYIFVLVRLSCWQLGLLSLVLFPGIVVGGLIQIPDDSLRFPELGSSQLQDFEDILNLKLVKLLGLKIGRSRVQRKCDSKAFNMGLLFGLAQLGIPLYLGVMFIATCKLGVLENTASDSVKAIILIWFCAYFVGKDSVGYRSVSSSKLRIVGQLTGKNGESVISNRSQTSFTLRPTQKLFEGTVEWNIRYPPRHISDKKLDCLLVEEVIDALLSRVGLQKTRHIGTDGELISGGQRQTVLLCRAIARRPERLTLANCLTALDPASLEFAKLQISRLGAEKILPHVSWQL